MVEAKGTQSSAKYALGVDAGVYLSAASEAARPLRLIAKYSQLFRGGAVLRDTEILVCEAKAKDSHTPLDGFREPLPDPSAAWG